MNHFSPYRLPLSSGDYLLHLESFSLDHKACQSWAHYDDSITNLFSRPPSTRGVGFGAGADEFQLCNSRPSKFDSAVLNGLLPLQPSMADAHFLQAFQAGQPWPDNLFSTNCSVYVQPQPSPPTNQRIASNPHPQQRDTSASSKSIPLTSPPLPQPAAEPTLNPPQRTTARRKRLPSRPLVKPSTRTSSSQPSPSPTSPQAASPNRLGAIRKPRHSVTEKRYRTNLNEKIALLRESIPSLRRGGGGGGSSARDGNDNNSNHNNNKKSSTCDVAMKAGKIQLGAGVAGNLKKAAIFSEATAHIRHLEIRNARLVEECQALRARAEAFEMLFLAKSGSCSSGSGGSETDFDVSPICY